MGSDRTPHDTFMQVAGDGQRISSARLRSAMERSPALHRSFLRYGHAFMVQTAQTALANGRSRIEERLARWLLMAHDRLDADEVPLTHEFLSVMLGVRRPGVTVALDLLEKDGLIRAKRGAVDILNRTGLRKISNGAYGAAEAEFQRLFR
ncbi:MAG TPA: Crp/Fnr family transcriptional regulator [Candidatus Acidoferrum sp.]|nr:Crp/Fnr family transcriptional regulator [Candidatus Acidoferrum sp.]